LKRPNPHFPIGIDHALKLLKKFDAAFLSTPSPSHRPSLHDSPIMFAPSVLIYRSLLVRKDHATDPKYSPRVMRPSKGDPFANTISPGAWESRPMTGEGVERVRGKDGSQLFQTTQN
jgi:hypothetical protein